MTEQEYAIRRARDLKAKGWTTTNIVRRITQEIRWRREGRIAQEIER